MHKNIVSDNDRSGLCYQNQLSLIRQAAISHQSRTHVIGDHGLGEKLAISFNVMFSLIIYEFKVQS